MIASFKFLLLALSIIFANVMFASALDINEDSSTDGDLTFLSERKGTSGPRKPRGKGKKRSRSDDSDELTAPIGPTGQPGSGGKKGSRKENFYRSSIPDGPEGGPSPVENVGPGQDKGERPKKGKNGGRRRPKQLRK